jgi:hypothetical protein
VIGRCTRDAEPNGSIRPTNDKTLSPIYSPRVLKKVPSTAIVVTLVSASVVLPGMMRLRSAGVRQTVRRRPRVRARRCA